MKNSKKSPLGFLITMGIVVISTIILAFILQTFLFTPQFDQELPFTTHSETKETSNIPENSATFKDPGGAFLFSYPADLQPLTLSNGVTLFLFPNDYDQCKASIESKNVHEEACLAAVFLMNGFELNPKESYEDFSKTLDPSANRSTYTGADNILWKTSLVLGQVYNFDAFTQVGNTPVRVSFQYGYNDKANEQTIQEFFHTILSTFEFTSQ